MQEFINSCEKDYAERGFPRTTYGVSKAGLIAYTRVQGKLHSSSGPLFVCCCPGYVKTDMSSHNGTKTPEEGADTPIWLATCNEPREKLIGKFFGERKELEW